MLDAIKKILGSAEKERVTSQLIRDAISAAEGELEDTRATLKQLRAAHPDILLAEPDSKARAHEEKIAEAAREVRRLKIAIGRLGERLQETEGQEAHDELTGRIQADASQ